LLPCCRSGRQRTSIRRRRCGPSDGAFATTTLVAQFLYATTPRDPFTFAGVVVGVIVVAIAAATVPARRALRINPLDVLRLE
jgi:ABC-type lipoprotein release transport system permease subunit